MRFGDKLGRIIDARGTTAEAVAEICGVSAATVGRWVNRGKMPRLDEAAAAASHFCVSLDSMVDDSIDEPLPRDDVEINASTDRRGVILTDDEKAIIAVYRADGHDQAEVLRALSLIKAQRLLDSGELRTSTSVQSHSRPEKDTAAMAMDRNESKPYPERKQR